MRRISQSYELSSDISPAESGYTDLRAFSGDLSPSALRGIAPVVTKTGNNSDNTLTSGNGSDSLSGLGGDDTLIGGGESDTLNRGSGVDPMVGGSGNDTFIVGDLSSTAFKVIGGAGAVDSSDRILYDQSKGKLYFDEDGNGGAAREQFAVLTTRPVLGFDDFAVY